MAVCKIESGEVVQIWRDVNTLADLARKYGFSGPEYRVADAVPGYRVSGGAVVPPPPREVPIEERRKAMVCSAFQAKAALLEARLLPTVEAAVANSSAFVELAWNEAVEFRRNSPTIAALQGTVGLTDEQIDALFIAAMQIEA